MTSQDSTTPSVVFFCVHNAGRSQMAAGFARHLGGGSVRVYSGGSEATDQINPAAIAVMAEIGIEIAPKRHRNGPTKASPQPTLSSPWDAATRADSSLVFVTSTGNSTTPRRKTSSTSGP